uniref:Predicted protein n=1 Tax=Physcomitrium patens TaxID=3218 RepID=A9U5U1_PHYPA
MSITAHASSSSLFDDTKLLNDASKNVCNPSDQVPRPPTVTPIPTSTLACDTAVSGVVSKAALTDASGVGTLVACGSLAEVEDGADIDSVNDDPDGRRAGGAASGERAKT